MENATSIRKVKSPHLSRSEEDDLYGAIVFEPDALDRAIVGAVASHEGIVALYDYDKLCYYCHDLEDPNSTPENAQEWVDYNMVRALPYLGRRAPRIGLWVNNDDGEEYGDDVEYIRHRGKIYVRL